MTVEQRLFYAMLLSLTLHVALFVLPGIESKTSSRILPSRRVSIRLIESVVPVVTLPAPLLPNTDSVPVTIEPVAVRKKTSPVVVQKPLLVIDEKKPPDIVKEDVLSSFRVEKKLVEEGSNISNPGSPSGSEADLPQKATVPQAVAPQAKIREDHLEQTLVAQDLPVPVSVDSKAEPLYLKNPPPEYPRVAKHRNQQGVVVLEVLVNKSGRVDELKVYASSGHTLLDHAAEKAVWKWIFVPARQGENTVDSRVRVPVRFDLHP